MFLVALDCGALNRMFQKYSYVLEVPSQCTAQLNQFLIPLVTLLVQ
jgi:hypothetical protein